MATPLGTPISSEEVENIIQDYKDVDDHIIISHENSFEDLLLDYVSLQDDVAFIEKVHQTQNIKPIKEKDDMKTKRNFERLGLKLILSLYRKKDMLLLLGQA